MGSIVNYSGAIGTFLLSTDQFIYREPTKINPRNANFSTSNPLGLNSGTWRTETTFGFSGGPGVGGSGSAQYFETFQYLPAGQYYISMILNSAPDRVNNFNLVVDGVTIGTNSLNTASEYSSVWRVTAGTSWTNATSSIKNIRLTTTDNTGTRYMSFQNLLFHRIS